MGVVSVCLSPASQGIFVACLEQPTEAATARLVASVAKAQERRAKFSRRRTFDEDADVSYINERNRIYNEKLERSFKAQTLEIKQNLERGTAL